MGTLKKNTNGDEVFFFIFSALNTMARNRDSEYKRVTEAMGLCAPYTATYVLCSLHFVGENFPPAEYLDPTSAFLSTDM